MFTTYNLQIKYFTFTINHRQHRLTKFLYSLSPVCDSIAKETRLTTWKVLKICLLLKHSTGSVMWQMYVGFCSELSYQQSFQTLNRGTQREYSSKPLKHSIVKRILVLKRQIQAYFYPLKIFHLFGFPSRKSSDPKIIGIKTYLFENFSHKKGSRKFQVTFLG